jgi:hypothetical protein
VGRVWGWGLIEPGWVVFPASKPIWWEFWGRGVMLSVFGAVAGDLDAISAGPGWLAFKLSKI